MALALGVKFTPASTGTGSFVNSATVQGYAGTTTLVDGATYRYRAESGDLSQWEWGTGVWTAASSTLTRATIALSSNANAVVNFTTVPQVGITIQPADVLSFDTAMSLSTGQTAQARSNIAAAGLAVANTFSVAQSITDATVSNSTSTGALKVTGGVGILGALNVGSDISGTNRLYLNDALTSGGNMQAVKATRTGYAAAYKVVQVGSTSTADFVALGVDANVPTGGNFNNNSIFLRNQAYFTQLNAGGTDWILNAVELNNGDLKVNSGTASSGTASGALRVSGGAGISGAAYIGGLLSAAGGFFTAASDNGLGPGGTGAVNSRIRLEGGSGNGGGGHIQILKNGSTKWYAGQVSSIFGGSNTVDDYSIYSAGFGNALNVAYSTGVVTVGPATTSSAYTNGALIVSGGVGVGGAINANGKIWGTTAIFGSSNGSVSGARMLAIRQDTSGDCLMGYYQGGVGEWFMGMVTGSAVFYMGQNASTYQLYVPSGGTAWTPYSDERHKDIIEPITGALEKAKTLRTVIGRYKTDDADKRRSFFIAQDWDKVLPEVVDKSDPNKWGLIVQDTAPFLMACINELQDEVANIKSRIAA